MNADELAYLSLGDVARSIHGGQITSVVATETMLTRIAALDPALRSYVHVNASLALAEAARADREISRGNVLSPLHGVPLAVKDLFWTADAPTAAGMAIGRDFMPPCDATAVRRLRSAGAVILGKLQMTEGAYSDYHPSIRPPVNPWHADYWAGISSSGPAVALAAGLCFGALASDTGGSIRWPSAACGLTGLKPTWGRISRHGVVPLAPTLDHVGVMARSAIDVGMLLAVVEGYDERDPTSLTAAPSTVGPSLRPMKIGLDRSWVFDDIDPPVAEALKAAEETFRHLGADIVEIGVPGVKQAVADWAPICAVEAAAAHETTYPAQAGDYGAVLAGVLEAGRALTATEYHQLHLHRMGFRRAMERVLGTVDFMLAPVQPCSPLTLEALGIMGRQPDLIRRLQHFTAPFNLSGHPTLTLPGGYSVEGLPIGIQLIGRHLSEPCLLAAGDAFQQRTPWHLRRAFPTPGGTR